MASESTFSFDSATVPQHAERLENENAELRKQLEIMTLKARISELERTNKVLQGPSSSFSTCESSANHKDDVSISTFATTANASTDAAASTDIAVSSDTAASIDAAASSEATFNTLRRDCYIECPL